MCIRDSVYLVLTGSLKVVVSDEDGREVILSILGQGELFGDCLLYTSDAADERSSVDIGGRRIIKKKNSVNAS